MQFTSYTQINSRVDPGGHSAKLYPLCSVSTSIRLGERFLFLVISQSSRLEQSDNIITTRASGRMVTRHEVRGPKLPPWVPALDTVDGGTQLCAFCDASEVVCEAITCFNVLRNVSQLPLDNVPSFSSGKPLCHSKDATSSKIREFTNERRRNSKILIKSNKYRFPLFFISKKPIYIYQDIGSWQRLLRAVVIIFNCFLHTMEC